MLSYLEQMAIMMMEYSLLLQKVLQFFIPYNLGTYYCYSILTVAIAVAEAVIAIARDLTMNRRRLP